MCLACGTRKSHFGGSRLGMAGAMPHHSRLGLTKTCKIYRDLTLCPVKHHRGADDAGKTLTTPR